MLNFCCDLQFHWLIQDLSRSWPTWKWSPEPQVTYYHEMNLTSREACKLNLRQGDCLAAESQMKASKVWERFKIFAITSLLFFYAGQNDLESTFSHAFLWKHSLLFKYCYQLCYCEGIRWEEDRVVQQGINKGVFLFQEHFVRS